MLNLSHIHQHLPGRPVHWFPTTDSTMLRAAELAREGSPHGTLVGADEQTAGVGRHGKAWHSAPGQGLWISIILRLGLPADRLPLVMLALGLAARDAIQATTSLTPDLRWPNDVLINRKKSAGIIAQLENTHSGSDAIIAGIGINVSQREFPPNLETPATSLAIEGANITREELLIALAQLIDQHTSLIAKDPTLILDSFAAASSFANGLRVRAEADGHTIEGVTCGLDSSGFLRVKEDNGTVVTILAGGVRPI